MSDIGICYTTTIENIYIIVHGIKNHDNFSLKCHPKMVHAVCAR
jgi:hypothetical protein